MIQLQEKDVIRIDEVKAICAELETEINRVNDFLRSNYELEVFISNKPKGNGYFVEPFQKQRTFWGTVIKIIGDKIKNAVFIRINSKLRH